MEFCGAVRSLGFEGNIRALWIDLGAERLGYLGLAQFAPDSARLLEAFRSKLEARFKTAEAAWSAGLAVRGQVRLSPDDFIQACNALDWDIDPQEIFNLLNSDQWGSDFLTLRDIEWLGLPKQEMEKEAKECGDERAIGPKKFADFQRQLQRRNGNVVRAWRKHFDPSGQGHVSQQKFYRVVRHLGFEGSIPQLWKSINQNGYVSLDEMDPEAAKDLRHFRDLLENNFGSLDGAWRFGLDPSGRGLLSPLEFAKACRALGFHRDPDKLFQHLSLEDNRGLSIAALEWLGLARDKVTSSKLSRSSSRNWSQWL